MDLSNLKAPVPNKKNRKRVGRGQGSGTGEQSGRGHNGAKSRSGYTNRAWFEGGQMPLQRRVPKFGFKNPFREEYRPVNLAKVSEFITEGKLTTDITFESLVNAGLANQKDRIKLLGDGDIDQKIDVAVHAASKSAIEKVEKAGGSVTLIEK